MAGQNEAQGELLTVVADAIAQGDYDATHYPNPDDFDGFHQGAIQALTAIFHSYTLVLSALGLRLYGYVCPDCKTWAEDMTPHCFNEHADDPVATLPFYVSASEPDGTDVDG